MNPLYELVPISEKPEKDGWYLMAYKNGDISNQKRLFIEGKWIDIGSSYGGYLKPIDAETLKAGIREELENCWDECEKYASWITASQLEKKRIDYINSVIDKLFKQ